MVINKHLSSDVPESVLGCEYLVRGIFRNSFLCALNTPFGSSLAEGRNQNTLHKSKHEHKNKIFHVGIFSYVGHY